MHPVRLGFAQRLLVIPTFTLDAITGHYRASAVGSAATVDEHRSFIEQAKHLFNLLVRWR
jgi:hypothetical protein